MTIKLASPDGTTTHTLDGSGGQTLERLTMNFAYDVEAVPVRGKEHSLGPYLGMRVTWNVTGHSEDFEDVEDMLAHFNEWNDDDDRFTRLKFEYSGATTSDKIRYGVLTNADMTLGKRDGFRGGDWTITMIKAKDDEDVAG